MKILLLFLSELSNLSSAGCFEGFEVRRQQGFGRLKRFLYAACIADRVISHGTFSDAAHQQEKGKVTYPPKQAANKISENPDPAAPLNPLYRPCTAVRDAACSQRKIPMTCRSGKTEIKLSVQFKRIQAMWFKVQLLTALP